MATKLYFFGDSICVGQHTSTHKTWVQTVARKLEEDFGDVVVINASVNGNTTRMALERMYFDVLSHKPDIVYIQFGLNDCNVWATDQGCERVSQAAYLANLLEMKEKALAAGVKKILMNTNHPTPLKEKMLPHRAHAYEASNEAYYRALKRFLENIEGVTPLDVRAHMEERGLTPESYVLEDGIHLNDHGHGIYADYIYPYIQNAVREVR